jgi:hypothetical protein
MFYPCQTPVLTREARITHVYHVDHFPLVWFIGICKPANYTVLRHVENVLKECSV